MLNEADLDRLKHRIKSAFALFDKESKGVVIEEEVGTIMRYLGAYPDELQISKKILPELQEDEPVPFVTYAKFETIMLRVLQSGEYAPDTDDVLLQAFRVLDPDQKGYVETDRLEHLLSSVGTPFRPEEIETFKKVAVDSETGCVYYEDYIGILVDQSDKALLGNNS